MAMTSQFSNMTSSSIFFWHCFFFFCQVYLLLQVSCQYITGSEVMTIFFYKWLTRNPEVGNTLVWVLSNIWRLRQVRYSKFGTNVSNKMLLNAAKCQVYSFTVSELLRENWQEVKLPKTRVKQFLMKCDKNGLLFIIYRVGHKNVPIFLWQ